MAMQSFRIILSLLLVFTSAANAQQRLSSDKFIPRTLVVGDYRVESDKTFINQWLGEPILKGIQSYGVESVSAMSAFVSAAEVDQFAQQLSHDQSLKNIYAVQVYGEDYHEGVMEKITGFTLIQRDSEQPRGFTISTYKMNGNGKFSLVKSLSGGGVGAFDCSSISTTAVYLGSPNKKLASLTVGHLSYPDKPIAETRFANWLMNQTLKMAIERNTSNRSIFVDSKIEEQINK
ncbi:hypothetical protein CWI84_00450 [Idiomarina tyrosinivorans]|uniref:Uncharacterized protein n=1 Tax=Idiomarina tyrosinivorans TaxID=1445662 RepID=A0A432ZU07_9GAMM|nr:hypothetical protein [Idiomarina tyrosinivorans]RUO81266.1 hypothetical protein CWI84_00450 [Idiomarina tyrosinivorans]